MINVEKLISLSAILLGTAGLAQANLIQNGSFEDTPLAPNTFASPVAGTGWTGVVSIFNGNLGYPWPGSAYAGVQFADISNLAGPSNSQTFSVGSSNTYAMSWADNTGYYGSGPGTSPYLVTISGSAGLVFSQNYDAFHGGLWQVRNEVVSLASGSYTLTLAPQGVFGGYDSLIDAVSLTETSVPDAASTAGAVMSALLVMAALRRRACRSIRIRTT